LIPPTAVKRDRGVLLLKIRPVSGIKKNLTGGRLDYCTLRDTAERLEKKNALEIVRKTDEGGLLGGCQVHLHLESAELDGAVQG